MSAHAAVPGGHDPNLAHHFESPDQQYQSAKLGMWIFLATEVLFFGGLFCAYAVYRSNHPEIFIYAHQFLDKKLGGINTLVLICSSFTMAWAVRAAQLGQQRLLKVLLAITLVCAFVFLGIKYVEYKAKWEHGLLWASQYKPTVHGELHEPGGPTGPGHDGEAAEGGGEEGAGAGATTPGRAASPAGAGEGEVSLIGPAATGPAGLAVPDTGGGEHAPAEAPRNAQIFFSIYFLMTGLHGLHVLGGIAVISWLLFRAGRGDFAGGYFTPVDLVGLYWHLVDLVWIYLFPLLYLIH